MKKIILIIAIFNVINCLAQKKENPSIELSLGRFRTEVGGIAFALNFPVKQREFYISPTFTYLSRFKNTDMSLQTYQTGQGINFYSNNSYDSTEIKTGYTSYNTDDVVALDVLIKINLLKHKWRHNLLGSFGFGVKKATIFWESSNYDKDYNIDRYAMVYRSATYMSYSQELEYTYELSDKIHLGIKTYVLWKANPYFYNINFTALSLAYNLK